MGKKRKKAGKAKKKRRRNRQPLTGDRHFRQRQSQNREPGTNVFPKGLQDIFLTDEPELSAEELRLRTIERAKEAREKREKKGDQDDKDRAA